MKRVCFRFSVFVLVVSITSVSFAGDFYSGKTIRFVVGSSPGGGYDTYTRMVARHIGKHIPGNPTTIVENMSGAGGLVAVNYIANKAKADGTVVGVLNGAYVLRQVLGDKTVRMDFSRAKWIGSPSRATVVCGIMAFTGVDTLKKIIDSKKAFKMGATREGTNLADLPKILNKTVGTKFQVITGYRGTAPIRIAMQKREIDGACWQWESMRTTARAMLDAEGGNKLIPFIIHSRWDDPEVKNIPLFKDVIKGEENLALYRTWVAKNEFQTPFVLPPDTPTERLKTLRIAFKATLEDEKLLGEAKKSGLTIEHVSGEEIEDLVAQILNTPPRIKESLQFLTRKGKS